MNTPWKIYVDFTRTQGTRYHIQDTTGADVVVTDNEEVANLIVRAVNKESAGKEHA